MALILERRLSKDQILELYLNDVWLGQRGSFAVHGVAEASRLFFAKHISNVSLSEAAIIAGVIQSPPRHSPFVHPDRAKERRNVVFHAMAERDSSAPMRPIARARACADRAARARSRGSVLRRLRQPGTAGQIQRDRQHRRRLHHARSPPAAHGAGRGARRAGARRRTAGQAQAAEGAGGAHCRRPAHWRSPRDGRRPLVQPVAVQPRHQRPAQPGSVFKPFVYLAAFEHALKEGRTDITPATIVVDDRRPSCSTTNRGSRQLRGRVRRAGTLRRALAHSRNVATIKVAETTGYGEVAALWRQVGAGASPRAYAAISLGVSKRRR